MKDKILLFGGTTEGRELAALLMKAGIPHTVSVATEYGEEILREAGEEDLLVGRKNCEEIEELITTGGYSIIVDATHPFATVVTSEIKKACDDLGVSYLRLSRNTDEDYLDGNITFTNSMDEAVSELKKISGNILLLTGSKDIKTITKELPETERIFARVLPNEESIRKCNEAGLSGKQIIAMQGPFSKSMNVALIREINAEAILTKESGRTGGLFEKLEAAKECRVKAFVIRNPENGNSLSQRFDLKVITKKIAELTGTDIKAFGISDAKKTKKKHITLTGIGPGKECYFTEECKKALDNADIIFGAESVASRIKGISAAFVYKYKGEDILEYLDKNPGYENPVVAFSGDISLCSGAKAATCIFENNGYEVNRISGISSVTLFIERLGLSLEDVRIISAHGRECNVSGYVRKESQLIILPSDMKHASAICKEILRLGVVIYVGKELGTDEEEIYRIENEATIDARMQNEKGKCLIYVKNENAANDPVNAMVLDDEILRDKVPMTKEEIRALSMRKLSLPEKAVFIDVGAGTGSISIEAALTAPGIKVFSVEKKEDAIKLLKENRDKFLLSNMEIIEGNAPEALENLPSPTHAFIGGSSGNMREIIDVILSKNAYARIVVNCVTLETFSELIKIIEDMTDKDPDLTTDIIQVGITRFKKAGSYHLSDALNPVYIATIWKEKKDE